MKSIIVSVLFMAHLAAGFSHCPKNKNSFLDITRFNDQSIETYGTFSVAREDVTFRLWTRDQDKVFAPLYYGHLRDEPTIRVDKPFKVIIHGWSDCADSEWYAYLKEEFLKKDDCNVIQIDWRKPAGAIYPLSAGYVKTVGQYVGEFLVDLNQTLGVPFENLHLMGHSLGAHISGFAGKHVDDQTKKLIGRITGMDPAGPLFLLATAKSRLSQGDALYVDVIHTDGGKFGYLNVLGHSDFYPNAGYAPQPGCILTRTYDIVDAASCSHTRSYYLFGESINSDGFISHECPTWKKYKNGECQQNPTAVMGNNIEIGIKGVYYLTTNKESPFAKNGEL